MFPPFQHAAHSLPLFSQRAVYCKMKKLSVNLGSLKLAFHHYFLFVFCQVCFFCLKVSAHESRSIFAETHYCIYPTLLWLSSHVTLKDSSSDLANWMHIQCFLYIDSVKMPLELFIALRKKAPWKIQFLKMWPDSQRTSWRHKLPHKEVQFSKLYPGRLQKPATHFTYISV